MYTCTIISDGHSILWSKGGQVFQDSLKLGPAAGHQLCPVEMLLASLGWCTVETVWAVARNKSFPLKGIRVDLVLKWNDTKGEIPEYAVSVGLRGDLSEREQTILQRSVDLCKIRKILSAPAMFHH